MYIQIYMKQNYEKEIRVPTNLLSTPFVSHLAK